MGLNFDHIFRFTLRAMKFNGSHPFIKRDINWLLQFTLLHGLFTVVFIMMVQNIILNLRTGDIAECCKNGTLAVVYLANSFSYVILLWKQSCFANLMQDMINDYTIVKSLPKTEQLMICQHAKTGENVSKFWYILCIIGILPFPFKQLVRTINCYVQGELKLIHIYDFVFPSIIEKAQGVKFVFTYVFIIFFGIYSSSLYLSFVPLGPILMLHACGQIDVVTSEVDVLFNDDDEEETKGKLDNIVRKLQYIYDFVDRLNECFEINYEVNLSLTSAILPVVAYEMIEALSHGEVSLEFLVFFVGGALYSSFPCYYSDLLMEKGENLRQAIYFCGWERVYCRRLRSTLCIMLQRALRPLAIRSLFRVVCLEALTDVFQLAYTLYNLMNAAWD